MTHGAADDSDADQARWHVRPTLDGERLIAAFTQLVSPLGQALPGGTSEVVLHDLSLLPRSIVAIEGDVTGRKVGDPATDLLLERLGAGDRQSAYINYETVLPDGRRLISSTIILHDVGGNPVAALCINTDPSMWETVKRAAAAMLGEQLGDAPVVQKSPDEVQPQASGAEAFARDIDELAAAILARSLDESGVPVELMQKKHKVEVVRRLQERGLFMLKDAVELAAKTLRVTRFTIYNYLNEIENQAGEERQTKEA